MATLVLLNEVFTTSLGRVRPGTTFDDKADASTVDALRIAKGVLWEPDDTFQAAAEQARFMPGPEASVRLLAQALRQSVITPPAQESADDEVDGRAVEDIYSIWGDSITFGGSASAEEQTGVRTWVEAGIRENGWATAVGSKGYGEAASQYGSGNTTGAFNNRLNWWENDGHSGQIAGFEQKVVGVDTGTGQFTVRAHQQGATRFVCFRGAVPAPVSENNLYFVQAAPDGNTFTITSTSGGSAITLTEGLKGELWAQFGLGFAAERLIPRYPRLPKTILAVSVMTNDAVELIGNRGIDPAIAAVEGLRRLGDYLDRLGRAASPTLERIFYFGMPKLWPGTGTGSNLANLQAFRALYMAGVPAVCAVRPKAIFRDAWSRLTQSQTLLDGVHPYRSGYRVGADEIVSGYRAVVKQGGVKSSDGVRKRPRRPKALLNSDTSRLTMTTVYQWSNRNLAFGVTYRPRAGDFIADGTVRPIVFFGNGPNFSTGIIAALIRSTGGSSTRYGLSVYVLGGAPKQSGAVAPYYNAEVFEEGKAYVVSVVLADGWLSAFINDKRINRTELALQNFADSTLFCGHCQSGILAARGYYNNAWVATGSDVTDYGALLAQERMYRYGERWPGTIDFRPLNEGTGSTLASYFSGNSNGSFTSPAWGTAEDGVDTSFDDAAFG